MPTGLNHEVKRPVRLSHRPTASQDRARQGSAGQARPASPNRATVGPPHLVTLVRAGARFENGKPIERPPATIAITSQTVTLTPHGTPIHRS